MAKENNDQFASCIIRNEEVLETLRNALDNYFRSLPEERLLEIESYMTCDSDEDERKI